MGAPTPPPNPDIVSEFASLTPSQQSDVLDFIRLLKTDSYKARRNKALRELAGSISHEDVVLMLAAIEEGCEQVDADGW